MGVNDSTNPDDALELEIQQLYGAHGGALMRYASAMTHTPESAPDAVQEVFLRYFVERSYGRVIDNPRPWLFRVLRNYLLDTMKTAESKQELVPQDPELLIDETLDPEMQLGHRETAANLALQLSARERESLALRSQGLSYDEIAITMGLASGTVGALLARAYRKLRDQLYQDPASGSSRMASALRMVLMRERNG